MSYSKAPIPNLLSGETSYQLDGPSGPYVAASCRFTRDSNTQRIACTVLIRQVGQNGGPTITDPTGKAITATHTYTVLATQIKAAGGQSQIAKDTLKIALGESDAILNVTDDIRDAISAAALTKASFDLGNL